MRRPAYTGDEVERFIAARVARKAVFERDPAPEINVHVRDSKHVEGPRLALPRTAWADFVTYAARG